jgi:hypothetical protein
MSDDAYDRRRSSASAVCTQKAWGEMVGERSHPGTTPRPAHVSAIQQPFTITDTLGRHVSSEGRVAVLPVGRRTRVALPRVKLDEGHRRKLRDLQLLTRDASGRAQKPARHAKMRRNYQCLSQTLATRTQTRRWNRRCAVSLRGAQRIHIIDSKKTPPLELAQKLAREVILAATTSFSSAPSAVNIVKSEAERWKAMYN